MEVVGDGTASAGGGGTGAGAAAGAGAACANIAIHVATEGNVMMFEGAAPHVPRPRTRRSATATARRRVANGPDSDPRSSSGGCPNDSPPARSLDDEAFVTLLAVRGAELLSWLASLPPAARDAAVEEHLGISGPAPSSPPGEHLIGYHPSGVAPIVHALMQVPVEPDDVVVDLGAGLGKVVFLTRLLTGATARGIELQPALVLRAREAAARSGFDVHFEQADARDADLSDGTVFFLYLPFTGPVLVETLSRLRAIAEDHAIVVCTLGFDLDASWLVRRPLDSFWLTIYDSFVPGRPPRPTQARSCLSGRCADAIAFERDVTAR